MSLEQAKLFIERTKTDEAFREKILALEEVADRLRLAKEEGYDFSEEEIKEAVGESGDTDVDDVSAAKSGNLCMNIGVTSVLHRPCPCTLLCYAVYAVQG